MAARHEKLVADILLALGSRPDIRCWRTQVGRYRYLYHAGIVTVGPEGVGDIEGILKRGRYFTVECKVGRDTQRDTQLAFERMVIKMGGLYVIARSVQEAVEGVCGQ